MRMSTMLDMPGFVGTWLALQGLVAKASELPIEAFIARAEWLADHMADTDTLAYMQGADLHGATLAFAKAVLAARQARDRNGGVAI